MSVFVRRIDAEEHSLNLPIRHVHLHPYALDAMGPRREHFVGEDEADKRLRLDGLEEHDCRRHERLALIV